MRTLLILLTLLVPASTFADDRILGAWKSKDGHTRLDIFDGFKPNRGAVLITENDSETEIWYWETRAGVTTLAINGLIGEVTFQTPDTFMWTHDKTFTKINDIDEQNVALLKQDKAGFIHKLTERVWLTSDEGRTSQFKSTFSTDSGVVETFSAGGDLVALEPWGISSGVLKISFNLIIEARVSDNYLIGLDERDEFVVFQAKEPVNLSDRSDLAEQRANFLTVLANNTWRKESYGSYFDYTFLPVEGPLQGREIQLQNNQLHDAKKWEYSPATGALRIGHVKYVGGLLIGNTLALLDENGDQTFYNKANGLTENSTAKSVESHRINEMRGATLSNILSGQFQRHPYLYSFQFDADRRTGFVHEWRSIPFTITAHELKAELFAEVKHVFEVEDLLFFDDHFALKRDASASRMRSKTSTEVREDQKTMESQIQELRKHRLLLRVSDKRGNIHEIPLPISSMDEVSQIEILVR